MEMTPQQAPYWYRSRWRSGNVNNPRQPQGHLRQAEVTRGHSTAPE